MNNVSLIGRLTKDVEVRLTKSGQSVAGFSLAVNESNGETSFFDCTAWNKSADILAKYTAKGSQIGVEGRLHQSRFRDRDGNNRSKVEVIVSRVTLLGSKNERENDFTEPRNWTAAEPSINDEDLPF